MFDVDNIEGLKKRYIFADGNIYVPDNFIIEKMEYLLYIVRMR